MADRVPFSYRSSRSHGSPTGAPGSGEITIGFVPVMDCAALVAAHELGFFAARGLSVTLCREIGWASVRDRLLLGEVQAAHAPGSLAYVLQAGIDVAPRACLTGFALTPHGGALTLSRELWEKGARDASTLRRILEEEPQRTFNFGAALEFSAGNYRLRRWLREGGIDPDRQTQITFVPSPILHRQLEAGHLDGYCANEPWNSVAEESGIGCVLPLAAGAAPPPIENVVLVLKEFAEAQPMQHLAMIAALIQANAWCEEPRNRSELVRLLALPAHLGTREIVVASSFARFADPAQHDEANVPDRPRARQVYDQVRSVLGTREARGLRLDLVPALFREDLYRAAARSLRPSATAPTAGLLRPGGTTPFTDSPLRMAVSG